MAFFKTGKSPVLSVSESEKEVKTKISSDGSKQIKKEDKKDNKKN